MFGILKDNKNALVFQYYLNRMDNAGVRKLAAECHFSYRRLRYTSVLHLTLLVRLESVRISKARQDKLPNLLFDRKIPLGAIF